MSFSLYTRDHKYEPLWWEAAPRPLPFQGELPRQADVVVVGSGYSGLHAALQTARGGRDTLVLEAQSIGWGCSSRNGGQASTGLKPTYAELARRHGHDTAFRIRREGFNALDFLFDFVHGEGVACDLERVGRFHAAHQPSRYEALAREIAAQPKGLEVEAHMVPRTEQHREIGSEAYHGGCVFPRHAALEPGRYSLELARLARTAGTNLVDHCPVTGLERDGSGFRVLTARGTVRARDVVVATNGYTGPLTPWHRRRVIPIGSYVIATEPLAPELAARLIPNTRVVSDTRKIVYYYRLCTQRRRMVFGGRVAFKETDPRVSGPRLHRDMVAIFPELAGARISHSWMGFVAYTFDTLPHTGVHDGVHYVMGYCGAGVSLASYFGMRIGQRVLGTAEGRTALDDVPFQTRPTYTGNPWFLSASIAWYKALDRLDI